MVIQPPEDLFNLVREFAKRTRKQGGQCNLEDYEYYKRMFHDRGLFGYESKIAEILGL
jgi:hypothetical protein